MQTMSIMRTISRHVMLVFMGINANLVSMDTMTTYWN